MIKAVLILIFLVTGSIIINGQTPSISESQATARANAAKLDLDAAAKAYRLGNFDKALEFSERALSEDPLNKTPPLFIARILQVQYKIGNQAPANVAKGRQAIEAYKRILASDRENEEAYKAIASLYRALREDELERAFIMQHAADTSIDRNRRAEAYIVLASKDWNCSNTITDAPGVRIVKNEEPPVTQYLRPKDEASFMKAKQCVQSGLSLVDMAILLDDKSLPAWSYKMNLLVEQLKIDEMDQKLAEKALTMKRFEEAKRRTDELSAEEIRKQP
jgi:tetratricopeptide (TPR) repeat protein